MVIYQIRPGKVVRKRAPRIYRPEMLRKLVPAYDGEIDLAQAKLDLELPMRVGRG